MSPFTACIVQTTSLPYDKQGNLDRALRAMEAAAARGASLILFPEMFLTGYLIRDQLAQLAEPYPNGPALTVLGQKAKALSLGVVMGMPLANPGGKPYNAVVMIDRDGTPAGFQAKTHFFGGEEKMFAPAPASGPLTPPSAAWGFWSAMTGSSPRLPGRWLWMAPS